MHKAKEQKEDKALQVIITGITWNPKSVRSNPGRHHYIDQLPEPLTIDLPDDIAAKDGQAYFYDLVETFCYNFLTRKYGHEVYSCQCWLPPVED